MSQLDVLLRKFFRTTAGVVLTERSTVQAGTGIEFADVGGRTVINATGSVEAISPLTIKGDLMTRDDDSLERLPIGSNGYTLLADSTQPAGMRWGVAPASLLSDGALVPWSIAADVSSVDAPAGWDSGGRIALSPDAEDWTVHGFPAPLSGQLTKQIWNISTQYGLWVKHGSATEATSANRIQLDTSEIAGGATGQERLYLPPGACMVVSYDNLASNNWRVVSISRNPSTRILNALEFGAVADGTTDNTAALAAMLSASVSRSADGSKTNNTTVWYFPSVTGQSYHLATTYTGISSKNIEIVSDGSAGASFTCANDYAFEIDGTGVQLWRAFRGIKFDECGVKILYNTRSNLLFERCLFMNAPDAGIYFEPTGGTPGNLSSNVWGVIDDCRFDSCNRSIYAPGAQSDMWIVSHCGFVRGTLSDIELWASNWTIHDCDFEQRIAGGEINPWVNLVGTASAGGQVRVINNRFGLETSGGNQPPASAIVVGPVGSTSATTYGYLVVEGNMFSGRNGGPTSTSADTCIRFNQPPINCTIGAHNKLTNTYNSGMIRLAYPTSQRGRGNILHASLANFTSDSLSLLSIGPLGSWNVIERSKRHADSYGAARTQQLTNPVDLTAWTISDNTAETGPSLDTPAVSSERGPDGLESTAWLISRIDNGTGTLSDSFTVAGDGPVTLWAWVKGTNPIDEVRASLLARVGSTWLNSLNTAVNPVSATEWQRLEVTVWPGDATALELHLLTGAVGDTATTGELLFAHPGAAYGIGVPDWAREVPDQTGATIALNAGRVIASGTAAASAGTVVGSLTLEEGWQYNLTIQITGTIETHGHMLHYSGIAKALRPVGGAAAVMAGTKQDLSVVYYDTSDGTTAPGGEADSADITVTVAAATNDIDFTITNNDAALDLQNVKIAIGYERTRIV